MSLIGFMMSLQYNLSKSQWKSLVFGDSHHFFLYNRTLLYINLRELQMSLVLLIAQVLV
jgi:hypothetical protein